MQYPAPTACGWGFLTLIDISPLSEYSDNRRDSEKVQLPLGITFLDGNFLKEHRANG
jgi:hypothetical protein